MWSSSPYFLMSATQPNCRMADLLISTTIFSKFDFSKSFFKIRFKGQYRFHPPACIATHILVSESPCHNRRALFPAEVFIAPSAPAPSTSWVCVSIFPVLCGKVSSIQSTPPNTSFAGRNHAIVTDVKRGVGKSLSRCFYIIIGCWRWLRVGIPFQSLTWKYVKFPTNKK